MPTNIASHKIPQGSHTFNLGLTFVISGYVGIYNDVGIPDTWEVIFVNPEGLKTVVTSGISFPDPNVPEIFFPVASGKLDKAGTYYFQVVKTTTGSRVMSEVSEFTVEESEPSLTY